MKRAVQLIRHAQQVVDALPFQIAIVDKVGIIQSVNSAWRRFAKENGADDPTIRGVGLDYLKATEDDASARAKRILLENDMATESVRGKAMMPEGSGGRLFDGAREDP